jgi:hypothetical protein
MKSKSTFSGGAPRAVNPSARRHPTHDEISAVARRHWEKSGRPSGRDTEIWLEAERRLRAGALNSADDALNDTRAMLDQPNDSIEDRLEPFGEKPGERSATSL